MFSNKIFIVHDYALEKKVAYSHIRKVKSPKTIRLTSDYLRFCKVLHRVSMGFIPTTTCHHLILYSKDLKYLI